MQSGYGGVSEIQQFMVDGCSPPSLFSISSTTPTPPPPSPPNPNAAEIHHHHHRHHQQNLYHFHHQHQQQHHQPPPPHFPHLIHPVPITQQLFHHPHPHQFQLFLQHQLGLQDHHDASPEASDPPAAAPGPSFLAPAMGFKLGAANESGAGGGRDALDNGDHDGILRGDDVDDGSESRRLHSWHGEEESAASIKQPFWRPLDRDYINRNNKRPKSPPEKSGNYSKKSKEALVLIEHAANAAAAAAVPANAAVADPGGNYKLFSELEAICKPGSGGGHNQTGSGSALTVDDNPLLPECAPCPAAIDCDSLPGHGSDSSRGGHVPAPPPSSSINRSRMGSSGRRKQRAKRRQQEQMGMVTAFFESLVKQVMDHQESLHCKFLQVMERRDQERAGQEEAWRKQEAARNVGKAASRAQERALAASREAAIVSFLEKITGEALNLPQFPVDESRKDQGCNALELYNADGGSGGNNSIAHSTVQLTSSRWPKAEVQALIRVRSGLEAKFEEPGLKGPLWEEVSSTMAAIGYRRSAKRCKEKWENINKYFRKTKDSGKKRPQHSKTCPYFHQLDQLYAKSSPPPSSPNVGGVNIDDDDERKDNSELLDAIVVSNDHQSYKFPDTGNGDQAINEAGSSAMAGKGRGNYEDNDDNEDGVDGEEEEEEEEGEGDSQEQGHDAQERSINVHDHHRHLHQGGHEEDPQHDSTFFFQRLRS